MKRKHTNIKHCQFTVMSLVTTVARTKFRSSSLTFYTYKSLKIVNTQVVGQILTKTFGTRRFVSRKVGQTDHRSQIAGTNLPYSVAGTCGQGRQVRPCLTCRIVQRKTKIKYIIKIKWFHTNENIYQKLY